MKKYLVSIICNVYNHEKYIKKAIDSFLKQKGNFNIEILIHDDASTDRSQEIIKQMQLEYPGVIKPIFQKENKFSHGVPNITLEFQFPRVNGDFIAICEGDDEWCDDEKIEKQIKILINNPETDICCHASYVYLNQEKISIISPSKNARIFPVENVILGGGGFVATSSIFLRRRVLDKIPKFYKLHSSDYSLQIMGSLHGGMAYTPEIMSIYNFQTESSWSKNEATNPKKMIKWLENIISMLNKLSSEYPEYRDCVFYAENRVKIHILFLRHEYKLLLTKMCYLKRMSLKQIARALLGFMNIKICY